VDIAEQISPDDPHRPDVQQLLAQHLTFSRAQTPAEHSFALDTSGLLHPAITFFSIREEGTLLGIGAMKVLDPNHAEIKSMHVAEPARGCGIGRALLNHILDVARARGFHRVSLETGTTSAFAPARGLYESVGFIPCDPFADYKASEDNFFMTLDLDAGRLGPAAPPGLARAPQVQRP
jgi:putative acetyltransferase